uniref:Uncharacterized protein n=1 Tax=Pleurocladia lacustris TaxID=246121 RepID=A0A1I9LVV7_9PHAE|nr:hypothetical protein [Pleurocladia lacustris]ANS57583.1 hypothetical protein [Pleurocladia lacustris]ANS57727.1 hypothetical protein [Pleurocladia lacustris]
MKLSNIFNSLRMIKKFGKFVRNFHPKQKETKKILPVKLKPVTYYYIIASSNFLLKIEPLEEVLRERSQYYTREENPINYWLVKCPKFLDSSQLSETNVKLDKSGLSNVELTSVISLNKSFTIWLKLRFHHVVQGSFVAFLEGGDIPDPLASNCPYK